MNAIYQKNQRRVLVTGGTRGIGKQIAIKFKENGYGVAVGFASNVEAAAKFEEEHGIKTFRWDAGDFQQCQTVLPQICEALGGDIEVLVNNAGITRDKMLHKQEKDNWDKVISNNLTSVFNMSRLVIEGMRESTVWSHHKHKLCQCSWRTRSNKLCSIKSWNRRFYKKPRIGEC